MPEIEYKAAKAYLQNLKKENVLPVYLIHGEEYLYKTVFDDLLSILVPGSEKKFNYEQVEGTGGNIFDVRDNLNTCAFMSKEKTVAYTDAGIFYTSGDNTKRVDKVKAAHGKNDIPKAAKLLAGLLGFLNLSLDDIDKKNKCAALKLDPDAEDYSWLDPVIDYCHENSIPIPVSRDDAKILQEAIEKGFSGKNRLIITTDTIDKRKGLYKVIKEKGMVIDCSVPTGNRMADKKEQEAVLRECVRSVLAKTGKQLDPPAYKALTDITGFDLRMLANNLETLSSYVGDAPGITAEHVHTVLKRTKKDPVFELTGAIADRKIPESLFFLDSLLSNELFPLQILSAIIKQIRKLAVVKDFTMSRFGNAYRPGMAFNQFKQDVMPAIIAYDTALKDQLEAWEDEPADEDAPPSKKKKKAPTSDLYIAANPNNPYPIFQQVLKSNNYTMEELRHAFTILSQADMKLKTTGMDQRRILEEVIIHICRKHS